MRIAILFGFILALAVPGHASTGPWDEVAQAVFRLYLFPDTRAGICTAWAAAPAGDDGSGEPQSYYLTAGHCKPGQYVLDSKHFSRRPLLASSNTWALDVGVGIRPDHRTPRTFLALDPMPARPGDRVIAIGFPNGMLATSVMTVTGPGPAGLVQLQSSIALEGGWSGAPLVSLSTGRVIGVLADTVRGESYIAMVVPASRISAFLEAARPEALGISTSSRPIGRILSR